MTVIPILVVLLLGMRFEVLAQNKTQSDLSLAWKQRKGKQLQAGSSLLSQAELQAVSKRMQDWVGGSLASGRLDPVKSAPIRGLMNQLRQRPTYLAEQVEAAQSRVGWRMRRHERYQTPTSIDIPGAHQRSFLKVSSVARPSDHAMAFIDANQGLFRLDNPHDELILVEEQRDRLGKHHVKFQQTYQGIPVWGHDFVVHLEANQQVYAVNAHYAPTPEGLSVKSLAVSMAQAIATARSHLAQHTPIRVLSDWSREVLAYAGPSASRSIWYAANNNQPYLIWHVQIRPNFVDHWYYFIDAATGDILQHYNATAQDGPATGSGTDLNGATRTLKVYEASNTYYMIDTSRPIFQAGQPDILNNPLGALLTGDLRNNDLAQESQLFHVTSTNNTWSDPVSVSAHFNVGQVFDYFFKTHNRQAIDGSGGTIISVIHATEEGAPMDNAFWNGAAMVYGDGDQAFRPLAGALDVAAHEMTHGVIQHTVNLEYKFQSGALNESLADVFGVMVDRDDWRIGEDVVLKSAFLSGALRDLEDPHNGGTSITDLGWQPSHMDEFFDLPLDQDNGGVHINSGIPNRACFLIASAIGREKTERIYYRVLEARYLNPQSNFVDMRLAAIRAATDLFGDPSAEVEAVHSAFDAVGILGDVGTPPPTPTPPVSGTEWVAVVNAEPFDTSLFLARPVIQSDNDIVQLTGTQVLTGSANSIAMPDGGLFIWFIDSQNFIRIINTDGTNEQVLPGDGMWDSISASPDGTMLAATTIFQDKSIYIFDLVNVENSKIVQLYTPTTGTGVRSDAVLYADALDWDQSSQVLVYDAFNRITLASGATIEYWDVNLLEVGPEVIVPLFPPQPEGISLGNPSFGQTNDIFLVFDMLDFNQNTDVIFAANLFSGEAYSIVDNGPSIGFPKYSPQDRRLVFQQTVDNGETVKQIPLLDDSIQAAGPVEDYLIDGQLPFWFVIGNGALSVDHD